MYIWRGKNRRDKRHQLLLGEQAWTAGVDDTDYVKEDERLRYEKEQQHVEYFTKRIRQLMEQYMETQEGKDEISLLRKEMELERREKKKLMDSKEDRLNEADAMRKNVLEIFRNFAIPGSETFNVVVEGEVDNVGGLLNEAGLHNMLSFLSLHLSKKQYEKYKKRFHLDAIKTTVSFEEFYKVFLEDLEERRKTFAAFIGNLFIGKVNRQRDQMTELEQLEEEESAVQSDGTNVSWFMQMKLRSVEAKVILVDEAVATAEQLAIKEFRIAHPPVYLCEQCDGSFPDKDMLSKHHRDKKYHREFFRKKVAEEDRFRLVRQLFEGDKGRRLAANRLIFSAELGTQQVRVDLARPDPYRPNLNDPTGKRHDQMLRGMFVTGFDPKSGIRPNYRRNGLKRMLSDSQTPHQKEAEWLLFQRNPTKLPAKPTLHELILVFNRCHDEFVDVVSTLDHPEVRQLSDSNPIKQENMMAFVRFEWSGSCRLHVSIIGEFNNWKPTRMVGDPRTDVFFHNIELAVGKYRYRFVVDGTEEKVDDYASQVEDSSSPIGYSNILMVTNASVGSKNSSGSLFQVDRKKLKFGRSSAIPVLRGTKSHGDDDSASVNTMLTEDQSKLDHTHNTDEIPGRIHHISRGTGGFGASEELISQIRHVDLRNMAVQDDGCWALGNALKRNRFIEVMDLSFNDISDEGIQTLAGGLLKCLGIHTLKLNGNGFGVDACRYLVEMFTNTKFTKDRNEEDAASSQSSLKSQMLQQNVSLKSAKFKFGSLDISLQQQHTLRLAQLELSQNRIGDDGMEILCMFLQHPCHRLQHLYLDSCYIGDDGMIVLAEALNRNRWLETLSLMRNNIQEAGSHTLAKALFYNGSLKHLAMSHNPLGPMGVKWLGDMLYHNDSLESLALRHVYLLRGNNAMGLEAICYGLKHAQALQLHSGDIQMRGIKKLDLSHNDLRDKHVIDLAHALSINTSLTDIILESNNFTTAKWWDPEKFVATHILSEMPTLTMSLQKNRQLQKHLSEQAQARSLLKPPTDASPGKITKAQAAQAAQQANSGYILDDVLVGYWTVRRQWKSLLEDQEIRRQKQEAIAKELERIQQEQNRITKALQHYLRGIAHYIDQEDDDGYCPCADDISSLAHRLREHMENMIYFDPDEFNMHGIRQQAKPSWSKQRRPKSRGDDADDFMSLGSTDLDPDRDFWETEDDDASDDPIRGYKSGKSKKKPKPIPIKRVYTGKRKPGKQLHRLLEPEQDPYDSADQDQNEDDDKEDAKTDEKDSKWFLPRLFGPSKQEILLREKRRYDAEERELALKRQHRAELARQHIPDVGMFMDCHMSLMSAVFIILSGQKLNIMPTTTLELHPERLVQCLNMLGMPIYLLDLPPTSVDSIQQNVDTTVSPSVDCNIDMSTQDDHAFPISDTAKQQRTLQRIADATMLHPEFTSEHKRPQAPNASSTRPKLDITNVTKNIAGREMRTTHPMIALHRLADYILREVHRWGLEPPPTAMSLLLTAATATTNNDAASATKPSRVLALRKMISVKANSAVIAASSTPSSTGFSVGNQEKFYLQRMLLLADLRVRPPITEARTILLDTLRHRAMQSLLTLSPTAFPTLAPHFICPLCLTRFVSQKHLYKHMKQAKMFENNHHLPSKPVNSGAVPQREKAQHTTFHAMVGNIHRRHAFKEALHDGQYRVFVAAMEAKLGLSLPAYYELSEEDTVYSIKDEFYPQICDTLGKAGRPIGIVESFRTLRVEFALGDYLLVNIRQEYGWVKYRYRIPGTGGKTSVAPAQFIPLLRPLPGFDWKTAGGRSVDCYFRVNDNLPTHIELKIRYRPFLSEPNVGGVSKAAANPKNRIDTDNVLGYIGKEDVVYVRYILGDWLQIRYHDEYVAWLLFRIPKPKPAITKPPADSTLKNLFSSTSASAGESQSAANSTGQVVPGTTDALVLVSGDNGTVSLTSMKIREVTSTTSSPEKGFAMSNAHGFPSPAGKKLPIDQLGDLVSPPSSPFRNTHASQNITLSNIVRQRKLDHADVPLAVTANNADIIFQDDIVTYELNGKFYRANLLKPENNVTRYKVHAFDRIRYGNPEVPLPDPGKRDELLRKHQKLEMRCYAGLGDTTDHLLRLPNFLQYLLLDAEDSGKDGLQGGDDEDDKDAIERRKKKAAKHTVKKEDSNESTETDKEKNTKEFQRAAAIAAVNREENASIRSPVKLPQQMIFDALMAMTERDLEVDLDHAFQGKESEEEQANRYSFVRDEIYGAMDNENSWQQK